MSTPTKTILLVDDTMTIRVLTRALLGREYEYLEAGNGDEGSKLAFEHLPDLILMDLNMPGTDGIEGLRRVKANPATAHIPVIILTTETDLQKRAQCRSLGCAEFLSKPIDKDALRAVARRWLPR